MNKYNCFVSKMRSKVFTSLFKFLIDDRTDYNGNKYYKNTYILNEISKNIEKLYIYSKYRKEAEDYFDLGARITIPNGLEGVYTNSNRHMIKLDLISEDQLSQSHNYYKDMIPFIKISDIPTHINNEIQLGLLYKTSNISIDKSTIKKHIEKLDDKEYISVINDFVNERINSLNIEQFYIKYNELHYCKCIIDKYISKNAKNATNFCMNSITDDLTCRRVRMNNGTEGILMRTKDTDDNKLAYVGVYDVINPCRFNSNYTNARLECKWSDIQIQDDLNDIIDNEINNKLHIHEHKKYINNIVNMMIILLVSVYLFLYCTSTI
jgi:hypothetical protein